MCIKTAVFQITVFPLLLLLCEARGTQMHSTMFGSKFHLELPASPTVRSFR